MTTLNNDELLRAIDTALHPERSGLLMRRGIAEGASHEHVIMDSLVQLFATHDQQLLEAILKRQSTLIAADYSTNAKGQKIRLDLSDREPFTLKAVPVEHIKSVFKNEGE